MEISPYLAAVESRLFWRVNKNPQTVFKHAGGREINEAIIIGVKTTDETGDSAGSPAQAKIDSAVDLNVKVWVANDELKRGVVRPACEKLFRSRRAFGPGKIERELPILSEIVNRASRPADRPEFLIFLAR